jgi:tetratricopeptide (TPR) repeat protein
MNRTTPRCTRLLHAALFIAVLLVIPPRAAAFYTDTDRAKDLMQAQRYREAARVLEKAVKADPQNGEAFYHLGLCRLRDRDYRGAEVNFRRAFELRASYGYVIGGTLRGAGTALLGRGMYYEAHRLLASAAEYQPGLRHAIATDYIDAGTAQLVKGRWGEAMRMYKEAVTYRPDARRVVATMTFDMGSAYANHGHYDRADAVFAITAAFDGMRRQDIYSQYRFLGDRADEENCLPLYRRALKYGSQHNDAIGRRLLAIADTRSSEREARRYRKEASLYVVVRNDARLYLPGSYIINLRPNETTEYWLRLPVFMNGAMLFSEDNRFELLFDDGSKYDRSKLESLPDGRMLFSLNPLDKPSYKFKIHALNQQSRIIMVVQ